MFDDFHAEDEDMEPGPPGGFSIADLLTLLFAVLTVGVLVLYIAILADPFTPLNPFPPATRIPLLVIPTVPPPTDTLTPSDTFTPSNTPLHTETPIPTLPPTETAPPDTPTWTFPPTQPGPTLTPSPTRSPFPFTLKPDGIGYKGNANAQGCQWSSIAGSVTDIYGAPLDGLAVHISGEGIDEIQFTGRVAAFGEAGWFEVMLGTVPRRGTYTVELLSRTGAALSEPVEVITQESCDQNVALVDFIQNHAF